MKRPYSRSKGSINLSVPCRNCGYNRGQIIVRFERDLGFVRCGQCDSPLGSVAEKQAGEVEA